MANYLVVSNPVQVCQPATEACLITNDGAKTIYLDKTSGVTPNNYSLLLAPRQSVNWSGGALYAVCAAGETSTLSQLIGGNTSVSPITEATLTGPVNIDSVAGNVNVDGSTVEIGSAVRFWGGGDYLGNAVFTIGGATVFQEIKFSDFIDMTAFAAKRYSALRLVPEYVSAPASIAANQYLNMDVYLDDGPLGSSTAAQTQYPIGLSGNVLPAFYKVPGYTFPLMGDLTAVGVNGGAYISFGHSPSSALAASLVVRVHVYGVYTTQFAPGYESLGPQLSSFILGNVNTCYTMIQPQSTKRDLVLTLPSGSVFKGNLFFFYKRTSAPDGTFTSGNYGDIAQSTICRDASAASWAGPATFTFPNAVPAETAGFLAVGPSATNAGVMNALIA